MEGKKVSGMYIKGMENPKNCYECPIRMRMGLYIICTVTKEEFSIADENILFYRLEDCPLVPVPDHGDLIDRGKLRNIMFIGEQCLYSWDEIEDAIDYTPTIIPADKEEEKE